MRNLLALLLAFLPTLAAAQIDPFEGIDRMLRAGRAREAFQTLSFLRQGGPEGSLSDPRFLLLEARILLANGLAEEARASLDTLRELPGWETQVDESEFIATELEVLRSLGQSADAIRIVEERLPPLDEIDPPYSASVTQLHLVYADLLLSVLRNKEAVRTLYDLLENGDPRQRATVARSLLVAASQGALDKEQWAELPEALAAAEISTLWPQFSRAAFDSDEKVIARGLLEAGIASDAPMVRAQIPGFFEESKGTEFLEAASEWILSRTAELPEESRDDRLAIEALVFEQNGKLEDAIRIIRENLWNDLSMRIRVASMAAAKGDIETASGIYTEMEGISPGKFLEPWGSLYSDLGMTEKALAVWSRIPSSERSPELGYRRWGQLLKSKGYLKEAVEAFKEGVTRTTQPALFAQDLLDVSISLGDVEGALTAYQVLKAQSARVSGIWSPERLVDQLRRTQQIDLFRRRMNEVLDASPTVSAPWRDFAVELQTELALQLNDRELLAAWLGAPPKAVAAYWAKDPARRMNHMAGIAVDLSLQGENELASRFFADVDRGFLASRPNALEAAGRSAGAIGDLSGALQFWQTLRDLPLSPPDQRLRATLAMARLYLDAHRPGRAIDLLAKGALGARIPSYEADATFLQALAYTQLHERSKALPLLQEAADGLGIHSAEARFWLAEWALWRREWGDAKLLYEEVLTSDPGQELANDTLWRLRYLRGLEEEHLPLFSMAAFFEGSGDWKEAESNYRNLAAALGGSDSDLEDWIYHRIGGLLIRSGRTEEGLAQWRVLAERSKNPNLLRRIEYETAALLENTDAKTYEGIVLNNANTLIGDLAREKMHEKLAGEKASDREKVIP